MEARENRLVGDKEVTKCREAGGVGYSWRERYCKVVCVGGRGVSESSSTRGWRQ